MNDKAFCPSASLRTREVHPGRIQHTRVPLANSAAIDLLNVYQHVWDTRADRVEQINRRQALLAQLEGAVRALPQRNLCVCAGDCNVQLPPIPGLVGFTTTLDSESSQSARDPKVLQDLVRELQLTALNTWTGTKRQAYTFEHYKSRTQIDYVFMRRCQATRLHMWFNVDGSISDRPCDPEVLPCKG